MGTEAISKATMTSLIAELHAIHSHNSRYWRRGAAAMREERSAHQSRQDRLQEIRTALELQFWSKFKTNRNCRHATMRVGT